MRRKNRSTEQNSTAIQNIPPPSESEIATPLQPPSNRPPDTFSLSSQSASSSSIQNSSVYSPVTGSRLGQVHPPVPPPIPPPKPLRTSSIRTDSASASSIANLNTPSTPTNYPDYESVNLPKVFPPSNFNTTNTTPSDHRDTSPLSMRKINEERENSTLKESENPAPISSVANSIALEARRRFGDRQLSNNLPTGNPFPNASIDNNLNSLNLNTYHRNRQDSKSSETSSSHQGSIHMNSSNVHATENITQKINKLKQSNNLALKLAMDAKNNAIKKKISTGHESLPPMHNHHVVSSQNANLNSNNNLLQKSISNNSPLVNNFSSKQSGSRTLSSNDVNLRPLPNDFSEIVPTSRPPVGFSSSSDSEDNGIKVSF